MRKARYAVAQTEEFTPDVARIVPLGTDGGECAVVLHNGKYYALGSLCPHQNAPLQGAPVESGTLVCRRHGYRFDLSSGDCKTVGGYGIPVYTTEVEDGTLYVSLWEYD